MVEFMSALRLVELVKMMQDGMFLYIYVAP